MSESPQLPPRLAVDADGYIWRVYDDGASWSMARINPDNSPIPQPVTFYEPVRCPAGCGCRYGTEDPDRLDCGCDGPCTTVDDDEWYGNAAGTSR